MKKQLGLQVTKYFTKESWLKVIDNYNLSQFGISFFTSDKDFLNISEKLDYLFILNFKEKYLTKLLNLKMLYIGVSDLDYLDKLSFPKSLIVEFSKGISSKYIAEYNLMTSLALIRNYKTALVNQINGQWNQEIFFSTSIESILDYKIGVIGMGHNGKATGQIFSNLGCKVSYLSRKEVDTSFTSKFFSFENIDDFLLRNEIIIITLPLRENTRNLIGKEQLISMGPDSYLINSSRSEIVNEVSLIEFLEKGLIKGAALDVSSLENMNNYKWYKPFHSSKKNSPMWKLDNLLITPHIAGSANHLVKSIQYDFIDKLGNL